MNREQEFAVRETWKALLFDVVRAIEAIRESIDRLEAQLEIQGRQVQRALEEGRNESILVSPKER